jgi:hypothetical protein
MEHKGTPQALAYHFKCLDYSQRGYITVSDINYWFRDITSKLHQANLELIPVEDVRDEVSILTFHSSFIPFFHLKALHSTFFVNVT